jgi:aspartyl-tRNA(Asn)/glutamyl-tRNA(Gln) amidotransferase subunit A
VEDAALVLDAIAEGSYTAKLGGDVHGMRIGVPRRSFWEWCDEPVESVVRSAIAALEAEGAEIVEVDMELVGYTLSAGFVIALVENATHHRRALRERAHLYGPEIRALLDTGAVIFGADYLDAQRVRTLVRREFRRVFDEHRLDVLATPSAPTVAPRVGESMVSLRGGPQEPIVLALVRPLIPFDLTGQPAVSLPCGFVDGLPVGLQLAARPFDEATLLQAAHAYEAATDWNDRRPPM